jgi:hypothetical protein
MGNKKNEKLARLIVVSVLLALIAATATTTIGAWVFMLAMHVIGIDIEQYAFLERGSLIRIGLAIFAIYIFLFFKFVVSKDYHKIKNTKGGNNNVEP